MSDEKYSYNDSDLHCTSSKRIRLVDDYCDEEITRPYFDANQVAKFCYNAFKNLPGKSGRINNEKEYTILAGILCDESIVALATGTKCYPENVCKRHTTIVDCHAEPLLKRAFKFHILGLVREHLSNGGLLDEFYSTVLSKNRYTLFVSQTPCGTFSRWKGNCRENSAVILETVQKNHIQSGNQILNDKYRNRVNLQSTKGECSKEHYSIEELRCYKDVGVNRKPGRGSICPSAGCIHKIAKWRYFGLQGKRLFSLIGHVIPIHRIVIGNCEKFSTSSEELLKQVFSRIVIDVEEKDCLNNIFKNEDFKNLFDFESVEQSCYLEFAQQFQEQCFIRSNFIHEMDASQILQQPRNPTGVSIVAWKNGNNNNDFEIDKLSAGRRQGTSKKTVDKLLPKVCNKSLERQFQSIENTLLQVCGNDSSSLNEVKEVKIKTDSEKNHDNTDKKESNLYSYKQLRTDKKINISLENTWNKRRNAYEKAWKLFQEHVSIFKGWPQMPDLE